MGSRHRLAAKTRKAMSMKRTQQPPAYRKALARYQELERAGRHGLTQAERDEMARLAAELDAMELALEATKQ
jgi:hypothetical protein